MAELALIGTLISAGGSLVQGVAANNAAQAEAAQMEEKGQEEFAAAQREAMAQRREGRLINSRQQALAAASGSAADSPTIVRLMTDVAGGAEYNAGTTMYGGIQRKKGLRDGANARRAEGQAALVGSVFDATGSAFSGGDRFGTRRGWW